MLRRFSTAVKAKDRFIILNQKGTTHNNDIKEATIYIKGFLTTNEDKDDFSVWLKSHNKIKEWSKNENSVAIGYSWQTGKLESSIDHFKSLQKALGNKFSKLSPYLDFSPYKLPMTLPIPVLTIGTASLWGMYKIFKRSRLLTPLGIGIIAVQDLILIGSYLTSQYHKAKVNANEHGEILAYKIYELRM